MPEKLEKVVLLSPLPYSTAGFAPIVLMNEMGFDREEGLQVTVRDLGVPGNAWRALMNREGDATFINTIFTFLARDKGLDMRIFACYARYQNRSFVVADESPTRSIEELKGSTLGLFSLDHEEFAMATLRAHGVDPERDVKFKNYRTTKSFDADKMATALKSREIKAIWLLDIMYGHLAEGVKIRRLPSRTVDALTPASSLCTNDEVLAKRPEALAGLTRAHSDSVRERQSGAGHTHGVEARAAQSSLAPFHNLSFCESNHAALPARHHQAVCDHSQQIAR